MLPTRGLNIALVYDRVNKFGGAERVLRALHKAFPDAPLYTSVYDEKGAVWAKGWDVRTSFLQKLSWFRNKHELLAPLMPIAFESFDFSAFDVVISVTSEAAKGILTKPGTLHVCYLLTPTRYLWSHEQEYRQTLPKGVTQPIFSYLKRWDRVASMRPDVIIPISKRVQSRCLKFYKRETAEVIYPPVLVDAWEHDEKLATAESYCLVVSRLVPYKRIDLAIRACMKIKKTLYIVGTGSDERRLKKLANSSPFIHFIGKVSDQKLAKLYAESQMFLSLADEDFGIAAVEAQACGKPVVCYKHSGTYETIQEGKTGISFLAQEEDAIIQAISDCEKHQWSVAQIKKHASIFNEKQFILTFTKNIGELWQHYLTENIFLPSY